MRHQVINLRSVPVTLGSEWVTLSKAQRLGVDLSPDMEAIGPRCRGFVYQDGYWRDVSTVHEVFVKLDPSGMGSDGWFVAEECAHDSGRIRHHRTSWVVSPRNQPLFMIGE